MIDDSDKPWNTTSFSLNPQGCEGDNWEFKFWNCDEFFTDFFVNPENDAPYHMEEIPLSAIKRLRDFFDYCLMSAEKTMKEREQNEPDLS